MKLFLTLRLAVLFAPFSAWGDEIPKLLIPVATQQAAEIRSTNDYFVNRHSYFAKRVSIVRVNGAILATAERIEIPLFDELSLTLETTRLKSRNGGASLTWQGRLIDPPISPQDIVQRGISLDQANFIHDSMFTISISAASNTSDEVSGTTTRASPLIIGASPSNDLSQINSNALRDYHYQAFASISLPTLDSDYELRALANDPQYHLLIEIDPDKMITEGPFDDPADPVEGLKRQQYRDFLNSLGDDPRGPEFNEIPPQ